MSVELNYVMVMGRLEADPVRVESEDGNPGCAFVLSVETTSKDRKTTARVKVTASARLAEICLQFLKAGRSALVIGKLVGENPADWRVVADQVQFMDGKEKR